MYGLTALIGSVSVFLQGQKAEGCVTDGNTRGHIGTSLHTCRTKETSPSLCGDTFASIALQLPYAEDQKNLCDYLGAPEANTCTQLDTSKKSLMELLVSEIFSF